MTKLQHESGFHPILNVSEANYFNVSLKWHDQEINGL